MGLTKYTGGIGFLKAGMAADAAGLSPALWADCPLLQMAVDPTVGYTEGDDFTTVQATGFPYNISGTDGTFLAVPAVAGGQAILLAGSAHATDNDECYVTTNNNLGGLIKADATKNWWFEASVKVSQITLAQGVFVGLAEETGVGADFMTDDTMALKVVDFLGFQIIAATDIAAIWQSVMALNGGARVVVSATAATAATAFTKLGMKSELGTVSFWVNGIKHATTTTSAATNFPLNQVMQVTFATKAGQATINTLTVDWWRAAQLR